jgi:hypothetical protein
MMPASTALRIYAIRKVDRRLGIYISPPDAETKAPLERMVTTSGW